MYKMFFVAFSLALVACNTATSNSADLSFEQDATAIEDMRGAVDLNAKNDVEVGSSSKMKCSDVVADVTAVTATGSEGDYQFNVTLKSPDTGCNQYANWWEVLDESGKLVYRRILGHSHVDEQPFTRSGGPANVKETDVLIIRAHMHPKGYGSNVLKGSVKDGFSAFKLDCTFAAGVESQAPLPQSCAF